MSRSLKAETKLETPVDPLESAAVCRKPLKTLDESDRPTLPQKPARLPGVVSLCA
jgi:hypothetical protein